MAANISSTSREKPSAEQEVQSPTTQKMSPRREAPHAKKRKHKKTKRVAVNGHKKANVTQLKVAIIDKDNPYGKISKEKEALVERALEAELDKLLLSSRGEIRAPIFRSCIHSNEIIRIHCEDEYSLGWLTTTVAKLQPWENSNLVVVQIDQLPKLTEVTLWVPVYFKDDQEEKETVIRRLARQNPEVDVNEWYVFQYVDLDNPLGHLLVFGIEEEDMQILRERSMRVFYLLESLVLSVNAPPSTSSYSSSEEEDEEAE